MSKVTLNTPASFVNDASAVALEGANNAAIVAAVENTLSRDGTGPNQMLASLDMNSQRIINLPVPLGNNEPTRLLDLLNAVLGNVKAFVGYLNQANIWTAFNTLTSFNAVNSTSLIPTLLNVLDGNTGAQAVTTKFTPTVQVSRIENITDNLTSDGSDGPAFLGANTTVGSQQAVGVVGKSFAQATAVADVVGVYGVAVQAGTVGTHTSYGGFFLGKATTAGSGSIGVQLQNSNDTATDHPYNPATQLGGSPFVVSLDVAYSSATAKLGQANILVRSGGGQTDVGLAILSGTRTADIRTDTTATSILLAGPTSHVNGVDLSAASISGWAYKSPNFAVAGTNGQIFVGTAGTSAGVISLAGQTSGTTTVAAQNAASGAILLPNSSTTLAGLAVQQTWLAQQIFNDTNFVLAAPAGGSGALTIKYGTGNTVGVITFPQGTTNFSATGGTSQVVQQLTAGGALTVGALVKGDVGLGNVDNTSDANKPVSTAQATSIALKANAASPTFTGTVSASGPFGAWTAYTPSVSANAGAITTSSAAGFYWQLGKTVFFTLKATVTTNGTGSGALRLTLPVASKNEFVGTGKNTTTGKMLAGVVIATDNTLVVAYYDGTYPAADGSVIDISGSYEIT